MNKYRFNITWSEEDEGYIVTCPEFPGLSAFGESQEKALAEAQIALKLFIKTYQDKSLSLPEPNTVQHHSGQLSLRLPKSLHAQAARMAADDNISLNQFICDAVRAKVTGEDISKRFVAAVRSEITSQSNLRNLPMISNPILSVTISSANNSSTGASIGKAQPRILGPTKPIMEKSTGRKEN